MNEGDSEQSIRQSRYACAACKRLKKKCDRREPECSLCSRNGRHCSYDLINNNSSVSFETANGAAFSGSRPQQRDDSFPVVYFMDSPLFGRSLGHLPDINVSIRTDLESFIDEASNVREYVVEYFRHVHPWMPFISRKLFLERILNPLGRPRIENMLLIAAIKLVAMAPREDDPCTPAYCHIKAALLQAELEGVLTFRMLQTLVLVAIYEVGHAIYPSAYLTVGYCARYGIALGIDKVIDSSYGATFNLAESEDERRTWWAVILLDRLLNLGCPEKAPVTREPHVNSILPIDDRLWEIGHPTPDPPVLLSSPPSVAMGRFGLTVQAAILLGRVLRNIREATSGNIFQEDEAKVLDSTIAALTRVSSEEGQYRGIGVCSPTTICHSARLVLNRQRTSMGMSWPSSPRESNKLQELEVSIAAEMLRLAQVLGRSLCGNDEISPFCLDAMYRSAIVYAQIVQRTGAQDASDALQDIKIGLGAINDRWKAAGAYLQLIEARDLTGIL